MVFDRLIEPDFQMTRTVRWNEIDASGNVHFANYFRIMEETEYAFLRSIGLNVVLEDTKGKIGFPRLNTELEIVEPLTWNQQFTSWIKLTENDGVQLKYSFEITGPQHQVAVRGSFDAACCRFPRGELPRAILIPDFVLDRLPMT